MLFSSLSSGHPAPLEKSLRAILAYVRNLLSLLSISFTDKDFNISDSGTKSVNGQRKFGGTNSEDECVQNRIRGA